MKRVVTAQEMRDYERERFRDGRADSLEWMERAARGIDEFLRVRYPEKSVLTVCGGGNNGGDGFALLRLLKERGIHSAGVLLAEPDRLTGDAKTNYLRSLDAGVRWYDTLTDETITQYDVVADAMFGTGLSRPLAGVYADAALRINNSGRPVVAVDIPSGVDATSGAILGRAVQADATVTFEFLKRGHLLFPGRGLCGETVVYPLSGENDETSTEVGFLESADISRLLPSRPIDSHKGNNGRALLCVGCEQYAGAALLSAGAALRAGAGLTTAAVPGRVKSAFSALPEAMAIAVSDGSDWNETACEAAVKLLPQRNAVCVGCGVGAGNIMPLIGSVLNAKLPAVLDADALNQMSRTPEMLRKLHPNVVLTPHPAEMARLSGEMIETILSDPIGIALTYAKKWNCVVLLKGATSCLSNGKSVRLNTTGNAGLAKGGSGDVLSGLITGLLAQGLTAFDAACAGAYLLGASAEEAFSLLRERMLLARDVIEAVAQTIHKI